MADTDKTAQKPEKEKTVKTENESVELSEEDLKGVAGGRDGSTPPS